jgi:hypothetical protein
MTRTIARLWVRQAEDSAALCLSRNAILAASFWSSPYATSKSATVVRGVASEGEDCGAGGAVVPEGTVEDCVPPSTLVRALRVSFSASARDRAVPRARRLPRPLSLRQMLRERFSIFLEESWENFWFRRSELAHSFHEKEISAVAHAVASDTAAAYGPVEPGHCHAQRVSRLTAGEKWKAFDRHTSAQHVNCHASA